MTSSLEFVRKIQNESSKDAWHSILSYAWNICSHPVSSTNLASEIIKRDRAVGNIDHYLATAGWDLWSTYEQSVPQTSNALINWWKGHDTGRGVLILDAFSLREIPWLLQQAEKRGFTIHKAGPVCAELPADTTPFARALGFNQRSSLANNGGGSAHHLPGAVTESTDMEWSACADLIGSEPDWIFWHHFPDHRLHHHDAAGKGISSLVDEIESHFTGDGFWSLIHRLTQGRRVIITSDHGYAASGLFPDANKEQSDYLKKQFKSGRWHNNEMDTGSWWVPPIDLEIKSRHGAYGYVNGRRKWKSAGGYPTLTHGGLTVLEIAVPYIEISRSN